MRALSRRGPTRLLLTNGLDEGLLAAAIAYLQRDRRRGAPRAGRARRRSSSSRRSACMPTASRRSAAASSAVAAAGRLRVPARRDAGGDHAAHAARLPDQPGQPDRPARSRATRSARWRAPCPTALVFVDEAYADFTDEHFLGDLRAVPERRRRPHVREGATASPALRIGAVVGDAGA